MRLPEIGEVGGNWIVVFVNSEGSISSIRVKLKEFRLNSSFDDQPFINANVTHVSCSQDIESATTHQFNAAISLAAFHTPPSTSPGREAVTADNSTPQYFPLCWVVSS